jgi:hypothetical protein
MRGNASRFPDKQLSVAAARVSLKTMLASARSLDSFTVDGLARMFRVPEKEIEYELMIARQRRQALTNPI